MAKTNSFDIKESFKELKGKIPDLIKDLVEVDTADREIIVNSIDIRDDDRGDDYSYIEDAKLKGRSYTIPVFADISLLDKQTGKTIERDRKYKVADIPKPHLLGNFLINGNDYHIRNQKRLKPGVYTRIKDNGELEAMANVKGNNFKIIMDPENSLLKLKIRGSTVPLYPFLKAMGIDDQEMNRYFGRGVVNINGEKYNKEKDVKNAVGKITKRLFGRDTDDYFEDAELVREYMNENMILDEDTTKHTLGKSFKSVTPEVLLRSASNLIKVYRGEESPDNRESLVFKEINSFDDHVENRLKHWQTRNKVQNKLKFSLREGKGLSQIRGVDDINTTIKGLFESTPLAILSPQTNPLKMEQSLSEMTITGEGGVNNQNVISINMRNVQPSEFGFIDSFKTPEGSNVGVVENLARSALKIGKDPAVRLINRKTGKEEVVPIEKVINSKIAFNDQFKNGKFVSKYVEGVDNGKLKKIKNNDVDYLFLDGKDLMNVNSIPFLTDDSSARVAIGTKLQGQAVSLKDPDVPIVQSRDGDTTYEKMIGGKYSLRSPVSGKVIRVGKKSISVKKSKDGKNKVIPYFKRYPLGEYSFIKHKPVVKSGDVVKKGDLLADSNFTKGGTLSIGKHLKTAFMPYKGYNFADGIVISETASKKMTSEHMERKTLDIDRDGILNKTQYKSHYPDELTVENDRKLDDDGVVKEGQKINPGEVMIAYMRKEEITPDDILLGRLSKKLIDPLKNRSVVYRGESPAVVDKVVKKGKNIYVYLNNSESVKIGDKIVGNHGNKGIVTAVLPDSEMPKNKNGDPVEVLFNPEGLQTRKNPGLIHESILGKIGKIKGKHFEVDNFDGSNKFKKVKKIMENSQVNDKEDLYDPKTNKKLGKVFVGDPYWYKLKHRVHNKLKARGRIGSESYDIHGRPATGGAEGSKKINRMIHYAMLAHGANENLKEMATFKSDKYNDDVWQAILNGDPIPEPDIPFTWDKFRANLKALNLKPSKGIKMRLDPILDKEIEEESSAEIKEASFIRAKDLKEEKGGLFDRAKTGGLDGRKWTYFTLPALMPNPIFEKSIIAVTGIKKSDYQDIMKGQKYYLEGNLINKSELSEDNRINALSGPFAIKKMLDEVDLDSQLKELQGESKKISKRYKEADNRDSKRRIRYQMNSVNRKIKYLKRLKNLNMSASDAYMNKNISIMPPVFRPIYPLPNGDLQTSDINYLYRYGIKQSNDIKEMEKDVKLPYDSMAEPYWNLYNSIKGIQGFNNNISSDQKGIMQTLHGDVSKTGFFQKDLLAKRVDMTGRSTIIPDPKIDMDEIVIPEPMAWKTFEPLIMRDMRKKGYKSFDIVDKIKTKSSEARQSLDELMNDRFVLANRAPTLHKFSMLSFKPKIGTGNAIKINPLVVEGFNADFDGDEMNIHVPVSLEANKEASRMLPSKNTLKIGQKGVWHVPIEDAVLGSYMATKKGRKTSKSYKNIEELFKDYETNKIEVDDVVNLNGRETTAGIEYINEKMPEGIRVKKPLDKKELYSILDDVAKKDPDSYSEAVQRIKEVADKTVYDKAFSVGIDDLETPSFARKAKEEIEKMVNDAYEKGHIDDIKPFVNKKVQKLNNILGLKTKNNYVLMANTGSRGNVGDVRQMIAIPGMVTDEENKDVPFPILNSYAEGLTTGQFMASSFAGRKGLIGKTKGVQVPGAYGKELVHSLMDMRISMDDCGTTKGRLMSVNKYDVVDRYLSSNVVANNETIATRNTLVTPTLIKKFKKEKVKNVSVRSPLYCEAEVGVCQRCVGVNENGEQYNLGDNVGVTFSTTLTEPLTQQGLNVVHRGITSSDSNDLDMLDKVQAITEIPRIFPRQATVSRINGKIRKIEDVETGGKRVYVENEPHFIPPSIDINVRKNDKVMKGDKLSKGMINPKDILKLRGMEDTREYISDSLQKTYEKENSKIHGKLFETITRGITNNTVITDTPNDSKYIIGDVAPLSKIEAINRKNARNTDLKDAEGKKLATAYGDIMAGEDIDEEMIDRLLKAGHKKVLASTKVISHEPDLMGVNQIPLVNEDWMHSIGFRRVKGGLRKAVEEGQEADFQGISPIPALAIGTTIGDYEANLS